jgi:hypothetical protein
MKRTLSRDQLTQEQMLRGICSEGACNWPIDGWCVTCRAKLCFDHLHEHRNLHARAQRHEAEATIEETSR